MPFHLDGYPTGDPTIESAHPWVATCPDGMPEELAPGSSAAGPRALLAAGLARFPDIRTAIVDRRTARSTSGGPTGSPAARWRCSRPSR